MRFRKFGTYEEQRDYTANKLVASSNEFSKLAGRIALTAPLPPHIKSEPFNMYKNGIVTEASWDFADHTHSEEFQEERLTRHAFTILYLGKRAGQLFVSATFDEKTQESHKKLHIYAGNRGIIKISKSEGLPAEEDKALFAESFVEDMELRVLKYDTPASAQYDQSFLDYLDSRYKSHEEHEPSLKVVRERYEQDIKKSIKEHRQRFGIPESGDPTI